MSSRHHIDSAVADRVLLGVDVGGTKVAAHVVDADEARSVAHAEVAAGNGSGSAVVESILRAVDELHALTELPPIIGVGLPGVVDSRAGTVRDANNLGLGPDPVPIAQHLTAELGTTVVLENDIRAAALGAAHAANVAGDPASTLVYVGVGTGLAAGLVIDGRLHRGADNLAGELGFVPVPTESGLRPLEEQLSGPAIGRVWPGRHAAADLFARAAQGEEGARAVARPFLDRLADLVVWLTAALNPDRMFIGGGIGTQLGRNRRLVDDAVRAAIPSGTPFSAEAICESLDFATDNSTHGALGAAVLARDVFSDNRRNKGRSE